MTKEQFERGAIGSGFSSSQANFLYELFKEFFEKTERNKTAIKDIKTALDKMREKSAE